MTPRELTAFLDRHGIDTRALAHLIGGPRFDDRQVRRWTTGWREIPDAIGAYIEKELGPWLAAKPKAPEIGKGWRTEEEVDEIHRRAAGREARGGPRVGPHSNRFS